jgi:hypothetical protein
MMLIAGLTALCIGSVGFHVRFLVALCKECKVHCTSCLVRLDPESESYTVCAEPPEECPLPRAA